MLALDTTNSKAERRARRAGYVYEYMYQMPVRET